MPDKRQDHRSLILLMACIVAAHLWAYHKHPFMAFYSDWLTIFGVAVAVVFHFEKKVPQFTLPLIAALPSILALIVASQSGIGMLSFAWDAILPIAYFLVAALAMVLGATYAADRNGAVTITKALALAYLVAGLLSVVIASMQFAGTESLLGSFAMQFPHNTGKAIRPYANIGQPNQLALLFCVSIAAVWWLYQVGRLSAVIAFVIALILIWGLALTQSRIGWIILPLFALLVWCWRKSKKIESKRIAGLVLGGLLLEYGLLILVLPMLATMLGAVTSTAAERIGAGSVRWVLIQQAWQISLANPWLGAGWYEFGPQQVQIGADFMPSVYSQHTHNIVLNFAAELGWPITILIFGGLGSWFYKGCLSREISREVAFATLFFTAVLVHSLAEYPLWYAYVLLPMMLLMGMVHQQQFGARTIQIARASVLGVFLLMAVSLISVAIDYRRVVVGFQALGWESLGLIADEGTTMKPNFTLFPQFYDYFRFAKTKAHEGMSSDEIVFMEHVAKRFGYAPVMMRMSLVYALNGRADDAVRSMMTISRLHPGNYAEAYQAWENMAKANPEKYEIIFKRLSKPGLDFLKSIRSP